MIELLLHISESELPSFLEAVDIWKFCDAEIITCEPLEKFPGQVRLTVKCDEPETAFYIGVAFGKREGL